MFHDTQYECVRIYVHITMLYYLTSVVCKMFKSIVRDQIMNHIEGNDILIKFQHGFVPGRSCSTQLVALDIWTEILDKGSSLDTIYLDFSKAFDSVPHERLCMKLENYGVKGKALRWVKNFLSDRQQKVVVNGEESVGRSAFWSSLGKCDWTDPLHHLHKRHARVS